MMVHLSLWADGGLKAEEAGAVEAHMASCPACRARWEAVQQATAILASEPLAVPAAGFTGRVMARVKAEQSQRAAVPWRMPALILLAGMLSLAALAAVGLIAGLGIWRSAGDLAPAALGGFVQMLSAILNWFVLIGALLKALSVAWFALPQPVSQLVLCACVLGAFTALPVWSWLVGRPAQRPAGVS